MPAELRLDRLGDLAFLQLESGVGEFRHHAVLGEPAEIAAVAGRILGEFGRDFGEVLAALDSSVRLLGFFLGRQKNVPRMDFLLRRLGLGRLVIGLLLRFLGRGGLANGGEQLLHAQLLAIIGELALELGRRSQLVGLGFLGRELEIDEIVEHVFLPRRAFELLRQAGADVGHRVGDILIGDRLAVDLGQHLRVSLSLPCETQSYADAEHERGDSRARAPGKDDCH